MKAAVTAPTRPPTRLLGYASDDIAWANILADLLESVPDLVWPTSVETYRQMSTDPQLTAILAAYGLPIRAATWTVDPTGCRPEVVRVVADDLGLPVAGQDTPAAARVRGVSWRQHLRSALSMLVYGHAAFAMQAEIRAGRARLIGLWERMQHTISEIRVDHRSGDLIGINQTTPMGESRPPEIPARYLLWYANDRQGASWQGKSLLRPSYAPWLLKREMQRVLATSSRRFGMGVSVVRALPGVVPTTAQFDLAAQFAQQARVGDQAGGALPPGFIHELIGLTGSAPDTLAFVHYLNREMSRSALTGFLDLGETETGSRALGASLIELLMLAIRGIADEIADTVTRQVAARLVEWNWGLDEPVPRVTVADVGSRREVTAEALRLLLDSGALSADPALEAWVRREYRLPERVPPPPAATPPPAPAARGRPRPRRGTPTQLELPLGVEDT